MLSHGDNADYCCYCDNNKSCMFCTVSGHDANDERQNDESKCPRNISDDG